MSKTTPKLILTTASLKHPNQPNLDGGKYYQMKRTLELELDFTTNLSPLELVSKVAPLVQEAVESLRQSLGAELEFDIFLVLDGREVRFVMEPV